MVHKIKVGDRVNYNNLLCRVVGIEYSGFKEYLELQPLGSSARCSVESKQVNKIMSEGIKDNVIGEYLYDQEDNNGSSNLL